MLNKHAILKKIADSIEMSFDVPESEKKAAIKSKQLFKKVIASLDVFKDHLNLIYDPFKNAQEISEKSLNDFRGAFFRYKKQVQKNLDNIKKNSFEALYSFNIFKIDSRAEELINGFRDSVEDIQLQSNKFFDILDDKSNPDFKSNLIKSIDNIKKICFELENQIQEGIYGYIDKDILNINWFNAAKTEFGGEEAVPYITVLLKERQEELEGGV